MRIDTADKSLGWADLAGGASAASVDFARSGAAAAADTVPVMKVRLLRPE
jgi:hypothetical protein